jgi:hypothetical protein
LKQCLQAELAGMAENGLAIAFHVFVEPDAGTGLGHDRGERCLADLKRIAPQIIAFHHGGGSE